MKLRIRLIQPRRDKVIDLGGDNGSIMLGNVVEAVRTEFSL